MTTIADAPYQLAHNIRLFFPDTEWDNAAAVAKLESGFNQFATNNTTDAQHPCGSVIAQKNGVSITAEYSIGYFQINSCNFPGWDPLTLYDAYQNVGTAHMLWTENGWNPWYFSCHQLGIC